MKTLSGKYLRQMCWLQSALPLNMLGGVGAAESVCFAIAKGQLKALDKLGIGAGHAFNNQQCVEVKSSVRQV